MSHKILAHGRSLQDSCEFPCPVLALEQGALFVSGRRAECGRVSSREISVGRGGTPITLAFARGGRACKQVLPLVWCPWSLILCCPSLSSLDCHTPLAWLPSQTPAERHRPRDGLAFYFL